MKVLPDAFILDPDRLARFKREAQLLASLNHPNIAAIYGLEGSSGLQALVLELVEGPTLADRIAHGPIPVDEALPIARQIAEALDAAHEQGIIHRDLKPANIKLRPDGTVKVLDFGLAKVLEPVGVTSGNATTSPTITSPAMTQLGVILGTAAYMSPEQAKGRPADRRSDVWAFGAVLYEMLSGQRAFKGDDISETLAAVLRQDIDWAALPASTPAPARRLMARCLDRDVRRRLRDIGEARIVLEEPSASAIGDAAGVAVFGPSQPSWRRAMPVALAAIVAGTVVGTAVWALSLASPAPPAVTRLSFTRSPTGDTLLFSVRKGSDESLATLSVQDRKVTPFDDVHSSIVTGAQFSPDGRWVAYTTGEHDATTVVVQPFPTTGAKYQLFAKEGDSPHMVLWSRDGRELFYDPRAGGFEAVSVTTQPAFAFGNPLAVPQPFQLGSRSERRTYDITPGGKFVGLIPAGQTEFLTPIAPQIQVVLNWFEELRARVPSAK